MKRIFILSIVVVLTGLILYIIPVYSGNEILSVTLHSPRNTAMYNVAEVRLRDPASIHIIYTEKKSGDRFRTLSTPKDTIHRVDLLLLKAGTEYDFQIILEGPFRQRSHKMDFKTREQSPWIRNRWVKEDRPHDPEALGNGMVLLCYGRVPGYIAMVDEKGEVRWYWQVDDIGVRVATFTPRGTILAMLRPPKEDVADDLPQGLQEILDENPRPQRRGKMGFVGGTAFVELDLAGNLLRRIDLEDQPEEDHRIIHHDIRMDKDGFIHTLYRPRKLWDLSASGGLSVDTLGGDGILVMDTLGNVQKVWNVWDHWDAENDPYLGRLGYDRFHMNGLFPDNNGDYLLSVPIEDQIWKVNGKTGEIEWKFGRAGDFEMDTASLFSFQHAPYLNDHGQLVLFDNGLDHKRSRTLVFELDILHKKATTVMDVPLPSNRYTSRMGSGSLLPNGNFLQVSSKSGAVMVTDPQGKILWEFLSEYVPYRAEYVPEEIWHPYFIKLDQ